MSTESPKPKSTTELLAEALQQSPNFQELVTRRAFLRPPIVQPLQKAHDWEISFSVEGQPGELITLTHQPNHYCRIEKIIIFDQFNGHGTTIAEIRVGHRKQLGPPQLIELRLIEPLELELMTLNVEDSDKVLADYREEKYGSRDIPNWGTPSVHFAHNALGSGIRYDTCQPNDTITVRVRFWKSCKFEMVCFGKQVI